MIILRTGDTLFYKNMNAVTSKLQHWVLNTILSHSSVICGLLGVKAEPIELEADIKVRIHTFNTNDKNIEVWRWHNDMIPQEIIDRVIDDYRKRYEDHWYGFIQWLTIAIRRVFELTMPKKKDQIRKWNILWGWGTTCSELTYLIETSILQGSYDYWRDKLSRVHVNDDRKQDYFHKVTMVAGYLTCWKKYNPNTFTPKDQQNLYILLKHLKIKTQVW